MGDIEVPFLSFSYSFRQKFGSPPLGNNESATDGDRNKCEDQNKYTNFE